MPTRYHPASPFLNGLRLADGEPLSEEDIARLIELMDDRDVANRDWATMFLAQDVADTPEIRAGLRRRVEDDAAAVRAEALLGLAKRDKAEALPLVSRELGKEECTPVLFEAAREIADPALLPHLLPWRAERSDPADSIDYAVEEAITQCAAPGSIFSIAVDHSPIR